jgi:hypothetical protein
MGNILTQKRNGGGTSATALDELTYNYHTTTDGLVSNRLYQVNDVVSAGNYSDDIDDQGTFNNTHSTIETANNYGYDELGNLVRDAQEEIASIEWTVYGKMKKITRNSSSSKADLEFGYDASGNRLWKKVMPKGSGAVISTYYYLRDAQGNEMCRYVKYTNTTSQLMYVAEEHSIYGSSRVGVDNRKDTLYMGAAYTTAWGGVGTSRRDLGSKSFELSNHLGNVLVTVSDKPIYKVSSTTIFFNPEITSISDYYPFGAPIQGRGYSNDVYRFSYNGGEAINEVYGKDNYVDLVERGVDTRLGRLNWSIDPLSKEYPWQSPYAYYANSPIWQIDYLGMGKESTHTDKDGNVVAVYNDEDNGVYKHDDLSKWNPNNSSLSKFGQGVTKMGETEHWDEFVSPETGKTLTNYKMQFGKSFDPLVAQMHEKAKNMDLKEIASKSAGGQLFDIKKDYVGVGALLNGKYATSRSAGNFLAGYNAKHATYLGVGISFTTFQQLAGALHIEESNGKLLSKGQMIDIVILGTYQSSDINKFVAPTYGEVNYQYRMSLAGWNFVKKK